jgi:hypothetical protein
LKKNLQIKVLLIILVSAGYAGCSLLERENSDQPVARAFGKYLYNRDLQQIIPPGTSSSDSVLLARNYIDTWVRTQLMLNKAEEALTEEQLNVNKKIEEYRSSLLIYSYRQKLLLQKMDTVIKDSEIIDYYENNIDNFILTNQIVKAVFVKVPLTAPGINDVRNWIRSGSVDDLDKLEKYCINYAEKFDMFNNSWIYFNTLMKQVPLNIGQPDRFLRYNRNIETSDSLFHYFVHISDYKSEGDKIPLELIRKDIISILLNKRKIEFYNDLEKMVYNEGVNRNLFEIY